MNDEVQDARRYLTVVLPQEAARALSGALLAISNEREELLRTEVGFSGPELDEAFDLIMAAESGPTGTLAIELPTRFEAAFRQAIPASIALLDEAEAETLSGRTQCERVAAQDVVVECLDRAMRERI